MVDVFISYSQKDRTVAEALAVKLTAKGLSVWWDTNLIGGEDFREAIEEQLKASRVVVVLWSPNAVESRFVRDEADVAAAMGKLVSLLLGDFKVSQTPLGFRSYQTLKIDDDQGIELALNRRGLIFAQPAPVAVPEAQPVDEKPQQSEAPARLQPVDTLEDATREEEAWKFVLAKRDYNLVNDFLREFPNSKYYEQAEARKRDLTFTPGTWIIAFLMGGVATAIGWSFVGPPAIIAFPVLLVPGLFLGAVVFGLIDGFRRKPTPNEFWKRQEEEFLKNK
jgi:hypothetical protein